MVFKILVVSDSRAKYATANDQYSIENADHPTLVAVETIDISPAAMKAAPSQGCNSPVQQDSSGSINAISEIGSINLLSLVE